MTVRELIEFLQTQPQDLEVAFRQFSEQRLMAADDIEVARLCEPRPDGWIQDYRPDMPSQAYLIFPGN